jgi:hypothetical protein
VKKGENICYGLVGEDIRFPEQGKSQTPKVARSGKNTLNQKATSCSELPQLTPCLLSPENPLQVTSGQIRVLKGQVSNTLGEVDKNLRTRDWKVYNQCTARAKKKSIVLNKKHIMTL